MSHTLRSHRWTRTGGPLFAAMTLAGLGGCSDVMPMLDALPRPPIPDALRLEKSLDRPANLIERGLSDCPKRIEAGEATCVKQALATAGISVPDLMALLPGCRQGLVCRYDYTTVDSVGFIPATATKFVAHWRVEFDFRKPEVSLAALPVTVVTF
jgi:hypothetical protein